MSLDKFLHDQKIVRASMLLLKHSDVLAVKETELSSYKIQHPCQKNNTRCWNRFANRMEWCENCRSSGNAGEKIKSHRTTVVATTCQLLKLCRTRARNWTAK